MTEVEWLGCGNPLQMLDFVRRKGSERKLRLFACACCRRIWPLLEDERSRRAVEVSERHADGAAGWIELEAAQAEARAAIPRRNPARGKSVHSRAWRDAQVIQNATRAAWFTVSRPPQAHSAARVTAQIAAARGLAWGPVAGHWQASLLRDFFGPLPFRPVTLSPAWLTWGSGTVPKLAAAVYEERAFDRLPILADALEEAGCDAAELLTHLRAPGPHVRGCWALDLLLGKS
jgi:hypothetical protein